MSCAQLIEKHGEAEFRELESEAIAALGKRSGAVIATGGGCVTREENYDLLHQNGIIFWLKRDIDQLPREGGLFRRATLRRCTTGARPATKDLPTTSSTTTAQWRILCRQFWIA
ncbi:MAG: shikimate kinase [Oscillibacter sp.]